MFIYIYIYILVVFSQLTSLADMQRGTTFFGVGWCNAVERSLLGGNNYHEPDVGDMVSLLCMYPSMLEVLNHVA
jgi:hypothetical protein